ncbi:tyrosine-type recombinase/integrase [Virgibacillus indicus]
MRSLTPHSFRHTHISMMTEAGIDLPTIMKRVGHEDPDTTLKVYTHVTEKMKIKSFDNLTSMNKEMMQKLSF